VVSAICGVQNCDSGVPPTESHMRDAVRPKDLRNSGRMEPRMPVFSAGRNTTFAHAGRSRPDGRQCRLNSTSNDMSLCYLQLESCLLKGSPLGNNSPFDIIQSISRPKHLAHPSRYYSMFLYTLSCLDTNPKGIMVCCQPLLVHV